MNNRVQSEILNGRMVNYEPDDAETLTACKYERIVMKPSKFVEGEEVEDKENSHRICPSCKSKIPTIEHSQKYDCDCGLSMQVWGNALKVWRHKESGWKQGKSLLGGTVPSIKEILSLPPK